jgi:hypothetical protein
MITPFFLGFGEINPLAFWLSFITGIAAFFLTVLTDHHLGIIRILSYQLHLTVDFFVVVVFVLAPLVLGFSRLEAAYYWIIGGTVLVVVGLHKSDGVVGAS